MRISDWSSDVCSSDLDVVGVVVTIGGDAGRGAGIDGIRDVDRRRRTVELARARRGVAILGAGQRAAVDRAEAGVVLQDGVADQFLCRLVASEVVAGQDIAGTASEVIRSEEQTSAPQSLMRNSYDVFSL